MAEWRTISKDGLPPETGWYVTFEEAQRRIDAYHFSKEYQQWDIFGCPSCPGLCWRGITHWRPLDREGMVSVKERLPEKKGKYLTSKPDRFDPDGYSYAARTLGARYQFWDDEITHWAPLPEEPREEGS